MCACSETFSHVQLFVPPWTVACQAPLSMGFSRQEQWGGLPFTSPGDLPNPGTEPRSPTLQADSLPSKPPGKPCSIPHHRPGEQVPFSPAKPASRLPCEIRNQHQIHSMMAFSANCSYFLPGFLFDCFSHT